MYKFSGKLRLLAIIFMVVGAVGIGIGFMSAPSTVEDVKTILKYEAEHGHGHDAAHAGGAHGSEEGHSLDEQAEHVKHQLQNKPWSALYVACFFFMMIALGALAFYAIQRAAMAGWSPILFRVMEGVTSYLPVGLLILLVILGISTLGHGNHLFAWTDPALIDPSPGNDKFDQLIYNKKGWLNSGWFMVRAICFAGLWIAYQMISKKLSRKQDDATDNSNFKKNFKLSLIHI